MSKKQSRSIVWILVVSFFLLLLPKSLWHDCSHRDHFKTEKDAQHSKRAFVQGIEKCYACDLHIPLLFNSDAHFSNQQKPIDCQLVSLHAEVTVLDAPHSFSLRGPPYKMI